ncbi:TonB-dependent receptor, partial [Bacillus tequilensis]|nr:TonB-dependent receptor [Bacillus tequilensis]
MSEAGQIVGSAGNSASGDREIYSGYFEVLLPFFDGFEVDIAGRYDDYSDYGSDFAPKISARWHPLENWTFRGSYGEGFRAPSLDLLSAKPSFSASFVTHAETCVAQGLSPNCETQINEWRIANSGLESEQSEQFGLGVVWDATDWLNMSLDYYNIEISNQIAFIGTGSIANCLEGTGTLCPTGLTAFPSGTTLPDPSLGLGIVYGATGEIVRSQAGYTNIGTIETSGYDFSARTRFDFGEWGRLNQNFTASYVD